MQLLGEHNHSIAIKQQRPVSVLCDRAPSLLTRQIRHILSPTENCIKDSINLYARKVLNNSIGTFSKEVAVLGGLRGSDDAFHPSSLGCPETNQRVLNHYTSVGWQPNQLLGQIVDHGIRLFLVYIITSLDHIEARQPFLLHDRVDNLLKTSLGGSTADSHGDVWSGQPLLHQLKHARAG